MGEHKRNLNKLKNTLISGVKTMAIPFKRDIMFTEKKIKILQWIKDWSGQLNCWAWGQLNRLNRHDWLKGYKKWRKK